MVIDFEKYRKTKVREEYLIDAKKRQLFSLRSDIEFLLDQYEKESHNAGFHEGKRSK